MDREEFSYDVVIIGAGIAGLITSIQLKKINPNISIAIIEKSQEVGGHIISGAIFEAEPLNELLGESWREKLQDFLTPVMQDKYSFLYRKKKYSIPQLFKPKYLSNKGNYIISLGALCRYLGSEAENLGTDIFTGFAGSKLLFNEDNSKVIGVELGDFGLDKDGNKTANYMAGAVLFSKYVVLAEGARGSLTKLAIKCFNLQSSKTEQKYSLGFKEIWQVRDINHQLGKVEHFIDKEFCSHNNSGGGFIYHAKNNYLYIGYIVSLDYSDANFSPYQAFQNFKNHPYVKALLNEASKISYGARSISSGGYYAVPKLTFPGGVLVGCSAGFVNNAKIKGSHNAVRSARLAAKYIAQALEQNRKHDEIMEYENNWRTDDLGKDLYPCRNFKALWRQYGIIRAVFDLYCQLLLKFSFLKVNFPIADYKMLKKSQIGTQLDLSQAELQHTQISSDLMLANIDHDDNQPCHLKVKDMELQYESELLEYHAPSAFYCPAAVYQWQEGQNHSSYKYIINSQNCIHCKTCDIKDPNQNIEWNCPQGGSGPNYQNM